MVQTRLDMFISGTDLMLQISTKEYMSSTHSEHSPLKLELKWGKPRPPVQMWRLRIEALGDPAFSATLAEHINQYFEINTGTTSSRAVEWEAHKATIRRHCISMTWGAKITLQSELDRKERDLRRAEKSTYNNPGGYAQVQALRGECKDIEKDLAKIDYKHHIAKLHKEGDRSGRLLAWLTREDRDRPPIGAIRSSDGTTCHAQSDINKSFLEYYKSLYSNSCPEATALESFLQRIQLPRLTPEKTEELEEPLDMTEIR